MQTAGRQNANGVLSPTIKKAHIYPGYQPYFLNGQQVIDILNKELVPRMKNVEPDEIYYYGTGLANRDNAKFIKRPLATYSLRQK